jgi:cob(I)alamin adenosyltransferase
LAAKSSAKTAGGVEGCTNVVSGGFEWLRPTPPDPAASKTFTNAFCMPTPSFIQLYTGNGKGKTTAGLGQAIRALGRGWKVGIIYFDKGGSDYGERKILDVLKEKGIDYEVTGLDRRDRTTGKFRFGVLVDDKQEGERALKLAQDWVHSGKYQLVVLDEINTAAHLGIVPVDDVVVMVKTRHVNTEVVMTGRAAPAEFIAAADLVTSFNPVKHYFDTGQAAREGIEF